MNGHSTLCRKFPQPNALSTNGKKVFRYRSENADLALFNIINKVGGISMLSNPLKHIEANIFVDANYNG